MGPRLLRSSVSFNERAATVTISLVTPVVAVPIPVVDEFVQILDLETLQCTMVIVHGDSEIWNGIHNGDIVQVD